MVKGRAAERRRAWWWFVVVVGAVVGLVTACGGSGRATPGRAGSPEQAARGFLEAVAGGHAGDALAYLLHPPDATTLTTDAVLAKAVRDAPITHITANQRNDRSTIVDVTYRMSGKQVSDSYRMAKRDGSWFIDEKLPTIPSFANLPDGVPITVNGVVVSYGDARDQDYPDFGDATLVLPGLYRFGINNPLLGVDSAQFVVDGMHPSYSRRGGSASSREGVPTISGDIIGDVTVDGKKTTISLKNVLSPGPRAYVTEEGRRRVVAAAEKELGSCLSGAETGSCGRSAVLGVEWPPVAPGTTTISSIVPGSTDLGATAPEWQSCLWSLPVTTDLFSRPADSICSEDIYIVVRATVDLPGGGTGKALVEIIGYTADVTDPNNIKITFALGESW